MKSFFQSCRKIVWYLSAISGDAYISNESPEREEFIGENEKLIRRSIAKISPFVYSSVEKKSERFLLLLETNQLEDLGSLATITEI